jgi:hypothetical protein
VKTSFLNSKSPVVFSTGLFIIVLICNACETVKTPSETALIFWKTLAENELSKAKTYCTSASQTTLDSSLISFNKSTFDFGKIIIDGNHATVETLITPPINQKSSFSTFLIQQDKHWKIECQKSIQSLSANTLNNFFNNLNALGKDLSKQLEQQLPKIEKELNTFGKELQYQVDEFNKDLEKTLPKNPVDPYQNTI